MKKVYLAGPDVFKHNAKSIGDCLKKTLANHGLEGMFPVCSIEGQHKDKKIIGRMIAEANMEMIRSCDAVLANLIPFRGPSADVGTVWECAYAKGIGKVVWGYNRSVEYRLNITHDDGMIVEDFDVWDNVMLVYGIDGVEFDWFDAMMGLKNQLAKRSEETGIYYIVRFGDKFLADDRHDGRPPHIADRELDLRPMNDPFVVKFHSPKNAIRAARGQGVVLSMRDKS